MVSKKRRHSLKMRTKSPRHYLKLLLALLITVTVTAGAECASDSGINKEVAGL